MFADLAWQLIRQCNVCDQPRLSYGRSSNLNIVFIFLMESGRTYHAAIDAAQTINEEDGISISLNRMSSNHSLSITPNPAYVWTETHLLLPSGHHPVASTFMMNNPTGVVTWVSCHFLIESSHHWPLGRS